MKIIINNRETEFYEKDDNIIESAKRAGINIPAPCYNAKRKYGCCKACIVMADGKLCYACSTKPKDKMVIITDFPKIRFLRKIRLNAYLERVKKKETEFRNTKI